MKSPLAAIRDLSKAYEVCADTKVMIILIHCPICNMDFDLAEPDELSRYVTHFAAYWDTHKPDFLVAGEAVQIVRRI